jgi:SAM-dependent methyltransferase
LPSSSQMDEARRAGQAIGYRGEGIYVRYTGVLQMLSGLTGDRILEIGCGHGVFDRLLPSSATLVGVDISRDEIETARGWADQHRPTFNYFLGRVEDLDLPAEWADITIISEVLEHVPEFETRHMLEAAIALTNRNGWILITVPNIHQLRNRARALVRRPPVFMDPDHDREYTLESARAALRDVGLEIVEERGAVLYGPFEKWVQKVVPADSKLRTRVVSAWPTVASHLMFLCARPGRSPG